jgi:hypothetical protein
VPSLSLSLAPPPLTVLHFQSAPHFQSVHVTEELIFLLLPSWPGWQPRHVLLIQQTQPPRWADCRAAGRTAQWLVSGRQQQRYW